MINWTRVSELRDEIGAEDFGEIVDLFLEEMDEETCALTAGVAVECLESKLHSLKGSALNLGFEAFADLCQAGEKAAAQASHDQIDLTGILRTYEASKAEFLNTLETLFAA